jgi:uroporphyrinogen-III decarboxylase
VEVAHALADLLVASPQVQAATVFDYENGPVGSVGVSHRSATAAVRTGMTLLEAAGRLRGVGEATQVHASLAGGDVFVVGRQGGPAILAVTAADQPAGLLFHDLKRCLASVAEVQR